MSMWVVGVQIESRVPLTDARYHVCIRERAHELEALLRNSPCSMDALLGILVIVFLLILVLAIYVVYAYTAPLAVLDLPRYQYNGVLV